MSPIARIRFEQVHDLVQTVAQRVGGDVQVLAVSKFQEVACMQQYIDWCQSCGRVAVFGENYVQEFKKKRVELRGSFRVHLIGSLQRNKARDAVALFDCIESVDSVELADALNREAARLGKLQAVLAQVNVSADEAKHGVTLSGLDEFCQYLVTKCESLRLEGLMCITRFYENPEDVRNDFRMMSRRFSELHSKLGMKRLSMGMSADFEIAIEEGANEVRVGTALFGERTTK